jgi:hypothetical protein
MLQVIFGLVVIALAAAAVTYFVLASQKKKQPPPGRRTVANLKVGDIVRYRMLPENNFTVTGFIDYRENGYTWREVRLVDGDSVRWLGIEEEDFEVELTMWREVELPFGIAGQIPREIQHAGKTYQQQESGIARALLTGQTGNRQELECRYWDYKAVGASGLLSIEQWGSDFEVSLGERVRPDELDIFAP